MSMSMKAGRARYSAPEVTPDMDTTVVPVARVADEAGGYHWDILGLLIMAALLIGVNLAPVGGLQLVVALPALLVAPGYALALALFPRRGQLAGVERLALSLAFSVALIVFTCLALAFLGLPIAQAGLLTATTVTLGLLLPLGLVHRALLPAAERFLPWQGLRALAPTDRADQLTALAGAVLVLAALGAVGYATVVPTIQERYTEFAVLNPTMGADGLTVQVRNAEHRAVAYTLRLTGANGYQDTITVGTLADGATWEQAVRVPASAAGTQQPLQLDLFTDNNPQPYRTLHLWPAVGGTTK